MTDQLETARRSYAEELRFTAHLRSSAVLAAFATVPRERFLGAGPWRVRSPMDMGGYWTTEDADPRAVYHDVLIALDEARGINNGQPILWAFLLDQLDVAAGAQVLHLGCGTGYYTAIMAELIGPTGKITAIEIDASLAGKAQAALMPWPQITVSNANGASIALRAGRPHRCERRRNPLATVMARRAQAWRPSPVSNDGDPRSQRDALGNPRGGGWLCGALSLPSWVH